MGQRQKGPVVDPVVPVGIQQGSNHIVVGQRPKAQVRQFLLRLKTQEAVLQAAALQIQLGQRLRGQHHPSPFP